MYIPKYFALHELLPPNLYNSLQGKEGIGWGLLDERLLVTLDELKQEFPKGSITVNNYYWGGDRRWSGLRTSDSPHFSQTSQHTFGRAADCIFSAYKAEDVRRFIIDNPERFPYINGIEDFRGMSWVHIDVANRSKEGRVFGNG